jgi:hypothetical protein
MSDFRRVYADAWPQLRASLIVLAVSVGSIGLFAVSAAAIGRNFGQFLKLNRAPTAEEASVVIPLNYSSSSDEYNDVIFLGDSSCLRGIDPAVFEKACGLRAYNLGSLWPLSIDGMVVTAETYLLKHPPPKIVALCICPEVPSQPAASAPFAREFVATYGRPLGILPRTVRESHGIDPETVREGAAIVMEHLVACLPGQSGARSWTIEGISVPTTMATFASSRNSRRGHQPLPGPADPTAKIDEQPGRRLTVIPEWRDGVEELARIVRDRHSRLMIRLTPMRSDARSQNYDEVIAWLRDVRKEFPDAVIDTNLEFYEPSLCWDRRHLNFEGTKIFSKALAAQIAADVRPRSRKDSRLEKMGSSMDSGFSSPVGARRAARTPPATIIPQ